MSQKAEVLQAKESEARAQLEKAQEQAKDLEQQLSQKVEVLQTKEQEARAQLEKAQEQVEKLKSEVDDKDHAVATLEKRLASQEDLSQQYFKALQDSESESLAQIDDLEKQIRHKQEALEEIETRLKSEEDLSQQYFRALQDAKNESLAQIDDLEKQIHLKQEALEKIEMRLRSEEDRSQQYFEALQDVENESLAQIDDLEKQIHLKQETLKEIETRLKSDEERVSEYHSFLMTAREEEENNHRLNEENKRLIIWMLELKHAYQFMAGTWKWKSAYAASRSFETFRLRHDNPSAIKQIQAVFEEFEKKRQSVMHMGVREGMQLQDHSSVLTAEQLREDNRRLKSENEQLTTWILDLKYAYEFLAATWKFRLANAAGHSLEKLRIGKKNISGPRQIEEIFDQFEKTQQLPDGV